MPAQQNIDLDEIKKFSSIASRWWDPQGEFKPLHQINPLRVQFIDLYTQGIAGKKVLDVGCGGGLLTEALARSQAQVTGIDMSEEALTVARLHALESQLSITYQHSTAEAFAQEHTESFELVTCLEMLEHVPQPESVVQACAQLTQSGGHLVFSTLNRTLKAKLLGVHLVEDILGWVPKGTHDANKFIRPSELIRMAEATGLEAIAATGIHYNPLNRDFYLSNRNLDVNYLVAFKKP